MFHGLVVMIMADLFRLLRHLRNHVFFIYFHHIGTIPVSEHDVADEHVARMYFLFAVVCMEDDTQPPRFIFEHGAVSHAHQVSGELQ